MLCRNRLYFCLLVAIASLLSGCGGSGYNTNTEQQCSNKTTDGAETDVDCGGSCRPCSVSKVCKENADCAKETCLSGRCAEPTCRNNEQDKTETDIDCGGSGCPACKATQRCAENRDCVSGSACLEGVCVNAICTNGSRDSNETDIDCGGDQCPPCAVLKRCEVTTDCASGAFCSKGTCYDPTCKNSSQDGFETDLDCGGGSCPTCGVGKQCLQNSDCVSGHLCIEGTCYVETCKDGKQGGAETDRDCGGSECPVCTVGGACMMARDCAGSVPCTRGKCGDPMCFNGRQDASETAPDCGGSCAACGIGKNCLVHSDCETLNCSGGYCAAGTCSDGSRNQGEAAIDCGDAAYLCERCAKGATCTENSNCASKHCVSGVCAVETCDDGIVNGTETGTDCGGSCPVCGDYSPCTKATDCVNEVCKGGLCQPSTCSDGVRNGKEPGKDCGGPCAEALPPQLCADGEPCTANVDCAFKNCTDGICKPPTCANDVKDPTETDKDCGGSCPACGDGRSCTTTGDCQSKVCNMGSKLCDPPRCDDGAVNGNETDINCGGITCTQRCGNDKKCIADSDCQSNVCDPATNKCLAPTCADNKKNGNETGSDCGGPCAITSPAKTCGTGLGCDVDGDCTSSNCCTASTCGTAINTCVAPSCSDGKVNQDETGIDCGGSICSKRCPPNQACKGSTDCDSLVCTGLLCQTPTCVDTVKNGNEAGKDCGTACPNTCPAGTPCKGPGDCQSSSCPKDASGNFTVCADPTCTDGIKNGDEICAVDRGGACPNKCAEGAACRVKADCAPVLVGGNDVVDCINFICGVPSCKDSYINGSETDLNCGGSCGPCANGKICKATTDCTSKRCVDDGSGQLRCAVPTCTDNTPNQNESGVDCGGTSPCKRCPTGFDCTTATDCANGVCGGNNKCAAPTCTDTVQNQEETDKDCGGPNCKTGTTACDIGKVCKVNADCKALWCLITSGTTGTCQTPSCTDTYQNGSETDLNCGGTCTTKCADTKKCIANTDCVNGWCNAGFCAMPSCTDSAMNGNETGLNCGGNCVGSCSTLYDSNCKQCSGGSGCKVASDCKSLNCSTSTCAAPAGSGPAYCVGRVLDGTRPTCNQCDTTANVNPAYCRTYLWCFYANNCAPGSTSSPADCASASKNGICSINRVNKTQDAFNAAVNAYNCGCQ